MTAVEGNWNDQQWIVRLSSILPNFNNNYNAVFTAIGNNLYDTLYNRIALTIINGADHMPDKFAAFNRNLVDFGDTVQAIKSKILDGQDYDPDNTNPYEGDRNKPIAEYHRMDDEVQYKIKITRLDAQKAFLSGETMGSFIESQLDTLQASNDADRYYKWIRFISDKEKFKTGTSGADGDGYEHLSTTSTYASGETMWDKICELSDDMRFIKTKYNKTGDKAMSHGLTLLITNKARRIIDKYLAGVYHKDLLEKVEDMNVIKVDEFMTPHSLSDVTSRDVIGFMILDDRALAFHPKTPVASSQFNAEALSTTNFLTVGGTYTFARFRNAYCGITQVVS